MGQETGAHVSDNNGSPDSYLQPQTRMVQSLAIAVNAADSSDCHTISLTVLDLVPQTRQESVDDPAKKVTIWSYATLLHIQLVETHLAETTSSLVLVIAIDGWHLQVPTWGC